MATPMFWITRITTEMRMHNPPHPGEFITEVYLEPFGISGRELAEKLDVAPSTLSRLLKGSIMDNVRLGRAQATEAEVLAALKAAQCMDIVEKFPEGIHTVIGTKGVYLSGGEQQRIAIARAMLKNAPILLLDEATAFADPDNEVRVQAAFAQLAKGKTVIMIAHRLSTVANADCIYVVQDGQIAESGTKDELCAQNGLFARMWQEYQASVQWKVAKEG